MADYGESYYGVPIKGPHNAAVCRKLREKNSATLQNDCRLPALPIVRGVRPAGSTKAATDGPAAAAAAGAGRQTL
jgi:hypothetical protein